MGDQSVQDRYYSLLQTYVMAPEEKHLAVAAELGRELVTADIPTEEIGEIHGRALLRLAQDLPNTDLGDVANLISAPLTKLLMAYGLAFRSDRAEECGQGDVALRESEERLRDLFENTSDLIQRVTPDARFIYVNRAWRETLGYSEQEVAGITVLDILHPDHREHCMELFKQLMSGEEIGLVETAFVTKDGEKIPVGGNLSCQFAEGKPVSTRGIFRDITERKRAEEKDRLQLAALKAAANGIVITDREGTIIWVNPAFTDLTGYKPEEAIGENPRILNSGMTAQSVFENLWRTILAGQIWVGEIINRRKDGSLYTEEQTVTPVTEIGGNISHFVAIKQDITERKRLEEELRRLSQQDGLTGIANRRVFDETLDREWQRGARNRWPLSLAMIDIDLFKAFNDTYGHQAGDDCLKRVASALADAIRRPADFVARYGGEEFAMILPETAPEGAARVAETVRVQVEALGIVHAHSPHAERVTISLGVASVVPSRDSTPPNCSQTLTTRFIKQRNRAGIESESLIQTRTAAPRFCRGNNRTLCRAAC